MCSYISLGMNVEVSQIISRNSFYVLRALAEEPGSSQRLVAAITGLSLGTVNRAVRELRAQGLLDEGNNPTAEGIASLEPFRVKGAVILAAGMSMRLAPLSYEHPKPLFTVQGGVDAH